MSLTCQQICLLAAQIAKAPGYLSQAGMGLNLVLEDLVLNRDLKMNRVTSSIIVGPGNYGPFLLETDYLRTYDMFYPMPSNQFIQGNTGLTMFLEPRTMEQYDAEFKDPSMANYPYLFATDLSTQAQAASSSTGYVYIYPQASGTLTLTHRYMKKQADIANPQTNSANPWFPYTDYLVDATAARIMKVTGDDRLEQFLANCEKMLFPYLIMQGDEQQTVHNVKLDPARFRTNRALKAVKDYPF